MVISLILLMPSCGTCCWLTDGKIGKNLYILRCIYIYVLHWVQVPRHWQWGLQGSPCEERPGLPHAGHSQLQPIHQRAWLSPSAKMVVPLGK